MNSHQVNDFIGAACSIHCASADHEFVTQLQKANELLRSFPEISTANLVTASVCGEVEMVRRLLNDPSIDVNEKLEPRGWTALLYLCFSRFLRDQSDLTRIKNLLECAKCLLDAGADPNTFFMLGEEKETALYAAVGVCNCAPLAELLLQAGAEVDDSDGSYHVAEFSDTTCIKLLFDHGMSPDFQATVLLRKLDFEDLEGTRAILDYGADVNGRGIWNKTPLHQAIMRGRSLPIIQLLVERGADVRAKRFDGVSAVALAGRFGRRDVFELLSERGAALEIKSKDEVIALLGLGCLDEAFKHSQTLGCSFESFADSDKEAIVDAGKSGNVLALNAMLEYGFPIDVQDSQGFSALHWASWYGQVDAVKFLLDQGAPLELKNIYGGTVIDGTVWGYANSDGNPIHAEEILTLLANAGADLSAISPFPSGNEKVDKIVQKLLI